MDAKNAKFELVKTSVPDHSLLVCKELDLSLQVRTDIGEHIAHACNVFKISSVCERSSFCAWMDHMIDSVHEWAKGKGWWDQVPRNDGELMMLCVCELAEAVEGMRAGNPPSEHIPEFTAVEEELADVIIRVMDYAGYHKLRLSEAILAKMEFNQSRPYRHGKEF